MYEYHNNILSIPARLLYEDWNLMAYKTYLSLCCRKKLIRTKEGKGKGNEAFVSFYDLPEDIKAICIKELGNPKEVVIRNQLENYILPDPAAAKFFAEHRKPNGRSLSLEEQIEKATSCMILNAIQMVFKDRSVQVRMFGRKTTKIWKNISEAVNAINPNKWTFSLPGNPIRLKQRYQDYLQTGYSLFIHKGEGTANAAKIKGEIADFILAQYCLPIKLTIPMLLIRYNQEREVREWGELTEKAIYNWLYQPEQERVWTLARHGREVWKRKFGHTLTRNKENWFPNSYWAIDGTKLDWIHFDENSSNKMGAKLKIDVLFDVYSEKIIGWSLSFTENHTDHFKAIKMAINEAGCRPYYLTYDNQSAHNSERMQNLYSSIVAVEGGTHHANKVRQHNNPSEQLFNRLQQEVITKFWFSDGQGVSVKRDDHRMNEDFILENKNYLKTTDQLYQAWEAAVNLWNNGEHSNFKKSRNEVYTHEMPIREELSLWDIMDKLWIEETKRKVTYKAHGLDLQISDKKYQFEVYNNANNEIDLEFRRKNVGKKFIVRYDPELLDSYIQLCEKDSEGKTTVIAFAQPKRRHENIPALMKEGDKEAWAKDQKVKELEYNRDYADYKALLQRTGITPEKEMEAQELLIKMKGSLPKKERNRIESEENIFSRL